MKPRVYKKDGLWMGVCEAHPKSFCVSPHWKMALNWAVNHYNKKWHRSWLKRWPT